MKRLQQLQSRLAAVTREQEAILDAIGDAEMPADQQTQYDSLDAEASRLTAGIEREQRIADRVRSMASSGELDRAAHHIVGNPRPAFVDDPKKGFRTSQEFFRAVLDSSLRRNVSDERLAYLSDRRTKFVATVGSDEHGTYSDPYGGFLVPSGFLPNLLQIQAEADPTAGRTTSIPMATPSVKIPARTDTTHTSSVTGGLVVYRRSETQSVTASRMSVELVELSATPLMGLSYATEELIADSAISFVALLEAGFRDEFASKILNEKINGTGAGTMEGVINADCTLSITAETGQDAGSIVYENIIKMRSRCWQYQNAIWLYNHDCLPQLMQLVMTIGTSGVPMWQTSARDGEPDMLLGRPAYPTEYCPTVGDAGDIILGNWSQYLEGTYQPLESAESLHVRFEYNERTFRFLMRNDGRCWWRTYLTPKKSSTTLSPFVMIAARA